MDRVVLLLGILGVVVLIGAGIFWAIHQIPAPLEPETLVQKEQQTNFYSLMWEEFLAQHN